ncbi:hypothetical protein [Hymenobacter ruricola]
MIKMAMIDIYPTAAQRETPDPHDSAPRRALVGTGHNWLQAH